MGKGKSKRRQAIKENQRKKRKRTKAYLDGGGKSKYARKREYLNSTGLWGWEVPFPKPW